MLRSEAIEKSFAAVESRLGGMTFNEFKVLTKEFEAVPIHYQGKLAGAMLVLGNEVHCCVDPTLKGKWFGRVALRTITRIINEYGEAISRASTEDGKKILLSLGFKQDGEIYRSTRTWASKKH